MNRSAETTRQTGKYPDCPYCGGKTVLTDSSIVYESNSYGNIVICVNFPMCNSYVGVHKNGEWMNYPLGRLADTVLRQVKKKAHDRFDMIWKSGIMSRSEAYKWLQLVMQKEEPDAHIGEMTVEECLLVWEHADKFLNQQYLKNERK